MTDAKPLNAAAIEQARRARGRWPNPDDNGPYWPESRYLATIDERTRERDTLAARVTKLTHQVVTHVGERDRAVDRADRAEADFERLSHARTSTTARLKDDLAAALKREEGLRARIDAALTDFADRRDERLERVRAMRDDRHHFDLTEHDEECIDYVLQSLAIARSTAMAEAAARKEVEGRLAEVLRRLERAFQPAHMVNGEPDGRSVHDVVDDVEALLHDLRATPRHPQESAPTCATSATVPSHVTAPTATPPSPVHARCPGCEALHTSVTPGQPFRCPCCTLRFTPPAPPTPEVDPDADPEQWSVGDTVARVSGDGEPWSLHRRAPDGWWKRHVLGVESRITDEQLREEWRRISRAATPEVDHGEG